MAEQSNTAFARLRQLRISPRKVRLVADLVRGKGVEEAISLLRYTPKRAALPVAKLIKSAAMNAQNEHDVDPDALYIKSITVDQGPSLKRWLPRAMGRATPLWKRTSHVTVVVGEKL